MLDILQNSCWNLLYNVHNINIIMSMESELQEYQLKLGILHHPALKTTQLMQFLQSQINDFLRTALPQSITQSSSQNFMANIDSLNKFQAPEQYVGVIIIYNIASVQSFQYAQQCLRKLKDEESDVFIILVQMQTGDKGDRKINAIGNEGQKLAEKQDVHFVKLTIQNCQDLINLINKNLYELIQNYYYPNQQNSNEGPYIDDDIQNQRSSHYNSVYRDRKDENSQSPTTNKNGQHNNNLFKQNNEKQGIYIEDSSQKVNYYKKGDQSQISDHVEQVYDQQLFKLLKPQQKILQQKNYQDNIKKQKDKGFKQPDQEFYLEYDEPAIKASKIQKRNAQLLIQKASELRQSRNREMLQQQRYIDQSITNAQQVLNNINRHFNRKMESGWFTQLKDSLYNSCQKNSRAYAKIKLTQQFIDEEPKKKRKNFNLSKSIFQNRMTVANKILNHKKTQTECILNLLLQVDEDYVLQFTLTQTTSIEQLSKQIVNQLGIKPTQKNYKTMQNKINKKIQIFTKEAERAVRNLEQKRISGRSYVKSRNIF